MASKFSRAEESFIVDLYLDEMAETWSRVKRKMADAPDGIQTSVFISTHPRFKDWRGALLADPDAPNQIRRLMKTVDAMKSADGGEEPVPAATPKPAARATVVDAPPPAVEAKKDIPTPEPQAASPPPAPTVQPAASDVDPGDDEPDGGPAPRKSKRLVPIKRTRDFVERIWDRIQFAPKKDENMRSVMEILGRGGMEDKSILRPTHIAGRNPDGSGIPVPKTAPQDFVDFFLEHAPDDVFLEACVACGLATAKGNLTMREKAYQEGTLAPSGVRA